MNKIKAKEDIELMSQNETPTRVFLKLSTLYTPYRWDSFLLKRVSAYISFEVHRPRRQENLLQQYLLVQPNLGFSIAFLSVLSVNLVWNLLLKQMDKKMKRLKFLGVAFALRPLAPFHTLAVGIYRYHNNQMSSGHKAPIESIKWVRFYVFTFQSLKSYLNTKWL